MKTKSIEMKAAELTRALIEIQALTNRAALASDTASGWEPVAVERLERVARIAASQLRKVSIG